MKKFKYKITFQIIRNLNDIERYYGQLEGMRIPSSLLLNLRKDNLVQSTFSSNSIEGNPLSHTEVTNLILGDRVPVNRDEIEIRNYFEILKSLDALINDKLSLKTILNMHKSLMNGVKDNIGGKIRNKSVVVGYKDIIDKKIVIKHNPPFHDEKSIRNAINELIEWVEKTKELPLIKLGIYHHQFVYIHPFEDGNGRVCRLSTALLLLKNKYQINKYFVLDDYYDVDKDRYSDKLHSADKGDVTEWLEYFTEGVKYSLQSALSKVENGLNRTAVELRPTKKELEAFVIIQQYKELKTSDLAKELKVTRQRAFNLLQGLINKGYVKALGKAKSTYYKLK